MYLLLQLIRLQSNKNVEEVLCQAVISRNIRWLFFANYIFQPVQGDQGRECIVITVLEQGQNIRNCYVNTNNILSLLDDKLFSFIFFSKKKNVDIFGCIIELFFSNTYSYL